MLFNEASGCEDRFGGRTETDDYFYYDDSAKGRQQSYEMGWATKEPPAGIDCLAVWNTAHAEYQRLQEAGENARMCDVFVRVAYKALAAAVGERMKGGAR